MPLLKRQLSARRGGTRGEDQDWWRLVFDTDSKRLYIEHEWSYFDAKRPGSPEGGTAEIEIAAYLAEESNSQGQRELGRLLRVLFEDRLIPAKREPPAENTQPAVDALEPSKWALIKSIFGMR